MTNLTLEITELRETVVYNWLCSTALRMNRLKSGTYCKKEKCILQYIIQKKNSKALCWHKLPPLY